MFLTFCFVFKGKYIIYILYSTKLITINTDTHIYIYTTRQRYKEHREREKGRFNRLVGSDQVPKQRYMVANQWQCFVGNRTNGETVCSLEIQIGLGTHTHFP